MSYFDNDSTLDNELDSKFQKHYQKKSKNNGATLSKISEIDPSISNMYNSVKEFVGRRYSGNTTFALMNLLRSFLLLREYF
jgi:hypothetical protein